MAPIAFSYDLRDTAISRWRGSLIGVRAGGGQHWRTKVSYYRAVASLLDTRPQSVITWRDVVTRVQPRGCRTTFYGVAGPSAKYPLYGALVGSTDPKLIQLAWVYRRPDAMAQLIDETKVWSYWSYRESLLESMRSGADPESLLRQALVDWALDHPALASASDHAPPACAVEDLVTVRGETIAPVRAYESLAATVAATVRMPARRELSA